MDSLPLELWHRIFSPFTLKEKMECMRVCRSWWRFFDKYTLLSNVEISGRHEQFTKFADMIKRLPHRRLQIETLVLDNCIPPRFNKRSLCNIYSVTRVLKVLNDDESSCKINKRKLMGKHLKTVHSESNIEFLADSFYCELASQVLLSNISGRLHTLQLDFMGVVEKHPVLHSLKHAPVLKELYLIGATIGPNDLEVIHEGTRLEVLKLEGMRVRAGATMPNSIMPVIGLTEFCISISSALDMDGQIKLYRYMHHKYNTTARISHSNTSLRDYNVKGLCRLYNGGYLDFVTLTTPSESTFFANELGNNMNLFKTLDAADYRLEKLEIGGLTTGDIFGHLAKLNQFENIHTLTLSKAEPDTLTLLSCMPSLTTLVLSFNGPNDDLNFDLTPYLIDCPASIRSLTVYCHDVRFDPFKITKRSLEDVSIHCKKMLPEFSRLVHCLPELRRLKLSGMVSTDINIVLSESHVLEEAVFTIDRNYPHAFRYEDNGQWQYYRCHKQTIEPVALEVVQLLPTFKFKSRKKTKLTLERKDIRVVVG